MRGRGKTTNLLVKPLVSGIPARASMRNVTAAATTGARFPRPAHAEMEDCGFGWSPRYMCNQKIRALAAGAALARKELGGSR